MVTRSLDSNAVAVGHLPNQSQGGIYMERNANLRDSLWHWYKNSLPRQGPLQSTAPSLRYFSYRQVQPRTQLKPVAARYTQLHKRNTQLRSHKL